MLFVAAGSPFGSSGTPPPPSSPGRRLGTVLVGMGVLEPSELGDVISDHTREIVYSAFVWNEGRYTFQEGPPAAEVLKMNVRTPNLILGGIGRIESWSRIDAALGGVDALYCRAQSAGRVLPDLMVSPEIRRWRPAWTPRSGSETSATARALPDIDVCRALWAFRVLGVARQVDVAPPSHDAGIDDDGLGMVWSGSKRLAVGRRGSSPRAPSSRRSGPAPDGSTPRWRCARSRAA